MQVHIKQFEVDMQVKSSGIELEVRTPDGSTQVGDCYVTMTGLVWCKGRVTKANGIKVSWADLATILASDESLESAVKAAKRPELGG